MATFGISTIENDGQTNWFGNVGLLCRATPATNGTVTSISAYLSGNTPNIRLAIYTGPATGVGATLLGESGSIATSEPAWNTATGFSVPVVAGTYYWLALQQSTNITAPSYSVNTQQYYWFGQAYGAFTTPVPAGLSSDSTRRHSIYATYDETPETPFSGTVLTCLWKTAMSKAPKASLKHFPHFPLHV